MTPEREREVARICEAALDRPAFEREAFVVEACAGDVALRREVESLLRQLSKADEFLQSPALDVAAAQAMAPHALVIGQQVGPYQIQGRLGAGGMAEVYRARDTKLGRDVAIKVLPRIFTSDPERLARFEREARLLAALNHSNIGAIYGLENADGVRALVLELVDGDTLADRIARGALSLKDALAIARQIADALDAAHEKGIVHRDLKPSNVALTRDGTVKVLDFGLAKANASDSATRDSQAHTMIGATREGVVLGTAAYMSPEQARGQAVDKRTDIWAFGCVLYEMLTGHAAFNGDTVSDTIVAILGGEPEWDALPGATPVNVRILLQRCLEKDPKRRLRDIGDARIELDQLDSRSGAGAAVSRRQESRRAAVTTTTQPTPSARHWRAAYLAVGLIVLALVLLAGGVGRLFQRDGAPLREPVKFAFEPPENVTLLREGLGTAVSPDGRKVAFVGQPTSGASAIWVRALNSQESQKMEGTDGATGPFWSPDGQFLGFFADGKLKKIASEGGPPQNICTTTPGLGATWNSSGEIVFNPTNRAALMRVSASGGVPQQLTTLDASRRENSHRWPSFLPDGRHFLFTARSNDKQNTAVYVGSLDSRETKRLFTEQSNAVYAAPGYLLFGREGTLMAQRFDVTKLELSGEAFPVAGNIDQETPSANAFFSISRDGSVIVFHEASRSLDELTWFDKAGRPQGTIGPRGSYGWPRLSPDGKRLAVWIPDSESGNRDIWIIDVVAGTRTRFTSNPANDWFPEWSVDGASLTFASDRTSPPSLYRKATSGESEEALVPPDEFSGIRPGDMAPPFAEQTPGSYAKKGDWIAFQSTKSGTREIYVRSFDRPEEHRISTMGGSYPRWQGDGNELFYVTPDNSMMVAHITLGKQFVSDPPALLFHICSARRSNSITPDYEVTPDGHRFLFSCQQDARKRSITVAIKWLDMVKHPAER